MHSATDRGKVQKKINFLRHTNTTGSRETTKSKKKSKKDQFIIQKMQILAIIGRYPVVKARKSKKRPLFIRTRRKSLSAPRRHQKTLEANRKHQSPKKNQLCLRPGKLHKRKVELRNRSKWFVFFFVRPLKGNDWKLWPFGRLDLRNSTCATRLSLFKVPLCQSSNQCNLHRSGGYATAS